MKELLVLGAVDVNRSVVYEDRCRRIERTAQIGCPQGSVSSSLIWKIGAEDLLEELTEAGVETTAYADDVAMLIAEKNKECFKKMFRTSFRVINNLSRRSNVKLNLSKTACMWIGRKTFWRTI